MTVGSTILISGVAKTATIRFRPHHEHKSITSGSQYTIPSAPVTLAGDLPIVGDTSGGTTVNIHDEGVPAAGSPSTGSEEIDVMTTDCALTAQGTATTSGDGVVVEIDGESFGQMAARAQQSASASSSVPNSQS